MWVKERSRVLGNPYIGKGSRVLGSLYVLKGEEGVR